MQADLNETRAYRAETVDGREGSEVYGNGLVTRLITDRSVCMTLARDYARLLDSDQSTRPEDF